MRGVTTIAIGLLLAAPAAAGLGWVGPAGAATLRTVTTLHGPHVLLSDLFDDAGVNATRVLGGGPAPGGRIVAEAAQLTAIARQFAVEWRPTSAADRAVLDWPGRQLPRDVVLTALREALAASGVDEPDCEIDLAGFTPPLVPFEGSLHPMVSQLDYDRGSGRFGAMLSITGDDLDTINLRITGRIDEMIALPVTTARLAAGAVLRPEDVHVARIAARLANREVARVPEDAVGLQLRHQLGVGQPLALADLMRPALVHRGAEVLMFLDSPGIALTAQGRALEAGAIGERIHVLNPASRAVIEAEIVGPDRVRIAPGTVSLVASARVAHPSGEVAVR